MANDQRKRNYTFVVYEDSAPENWRDLLGEQHVPMFISPYHCDDKNPDETPKKPHWHVVLMYAGVHPESDAQEISNLCSGVKVQVVKDVDSMARYLCHLDNPEKAQYKPSDVISLGGVDYLEKIQRPADNENALNEMMDWCIEQGCFSFFRLANYARKERPDWFRVISTSKTVFLTAWLKSMQWEASQGNID